MKMSKNADVQSRQWDGKTEHMHGGWGREGVRVPGCQGVRA
jgi:hypothetical protein